MRSSGYKRLLGIIVALFAFMLVTGYALFSLSGSISFFYSPTEVLNKGYFSKEVRVGGIVSDIKKFPDRTEFIISDTSSGLEVTHKGLSPALMQAGIEVVVLGSIKDGRMQSKQILIKHDERYYPPKDF